MTHNCSSFYSVGLRHILMIDINNNLWSFGSNDFGQLGIGDMNSVDANLIEGDYISVYCGSTYSIIIDSEYNVWACGNNNLYGFNSCNKFTKINNLPPIIQCDTNFNTIVLLDINGNVWKVGANKYPKIDFIEFNKLKAFTQVTGIPKIKKVIAGTDKCFMIDYNGQVWMLGSNYPNIGLGNIKEINILQATKIPNLPKIINIADSGTNAPPIYLSEDGDIYRVPYYLLSKQNDRVCINVSLKENYPKMDNIFSGYGITVEGNLFAFDNNSNINIPEIIHVKRCGLCKLFLTQTGTLHGTFSPELNNIIYKDSYKNSTNMINQLPTCKHSVSRAKSARK